MKDNRVVFGTDMKFSQPSIIICVDRHGRFRELRNIEDLKGLNRLIEPETVKFLYEAKKKRLVIFKNNGELVIFGKDIDEFSLSRCLVYLKSTLRLPIWEVWTGIHFDRTSRDFKTTLLIERFEHGSRKKKRILQGGSNT